MSENALENRVNQLEKTVALLVEEVENLKPKKPLPISPQIIPQHINNDEEFTLLAGYLQDTNWPNAVDPSLICNQQSEEEKFDRAEGIADMVITKTVKGVKFLDFGCGQGHVAEKILAQDCKLAIGYDIEEQNWDKREKNDKFLLTTKWEEVKSRGPYDIILVYDVIDHIVTPDYKIIDPHNPPKELIATFEAIKSVTAPQGTIYIRCHPWTSRHGSHLYQKLNKAYVHLVFSDEELIKLGVAEASLPIQRVIHPLDTYSKIFSLAGLKNIRENARLTEPVEPFFERNPVIVKRIKQNWANSHEEGLRLGHYFPIFQMEMIFLDFLINNS